LLPCGEVSPASNFAINPAKAPGCSLVVPLAIAKQKPQRNLCPWIQFSPPNFGPGDNTALTINPTIGYSRALASRARTLIGQIAFFPASSGVARKSADVEPLAVRLPSATQIHRIRGQPVGCELLTSPRVVATVSIKARDDYYNAADTMSARRGSGQLLLRFVLPFSVVSASCVPPCAKPVPFPIPMHVDFHGLYFRFAAGSLAGSKYVVSVGP
jgi:hypothetical protein